MTTCDRPADDSGYMAYIRAIRREIEPEPNVVRIDAIKRLAESPIADERRAAAFFVDYHPLGRDLLRSLAVDEDPEVRAAAAYSKAVQTDPRTLHRLMQDRTAGVRIFAAHTAAGSLTPSILGRYADAEPHPGPARMLAIMTDQAEVLCALCERWSLRVTRGECVLIAIAENPATPMALLWEMAEHPVEAIRDAVKRNRVLRDEEDSVYDPRPWADMDDLAGWEGHERENDWLTRLRDDIADL